MVLHAVRWAPEFEGTLSVMVLHAVSWAPAWAWTSWRNKGERQSAGEKLAFAQQLSGRVHVGTWAGGNKNPNLRISQEKEIMARCASLIPFVTPVLSGPGSHIRMKMGWKVLSNTIKSGVWFFPGCRRLVREWGLADAHGCG